MSEQEKEARMMAKIERDEVIHNADELTEDYKQNLVHLMLMQADSELAGAFGYVPWIMKAVSTKEMLTVSAIAHDEVRHARVMYQLLEELGVDIESRVKEFDFTLRVGDEIELGTVRAASDQRVNIFYYPIPTWYDFIMFNVLMDRGAGHQLLDACTCSYGPWVAVMEGIMKEEEMHIAHGDYWLKKLGRSEKHRKATQEALDIWYPRVMNIFGRPNSSRNKTYRKYGIKKRDNHEVRMTFAAEVAQVVAEAGLVMPKWETPSDWSHLPADGVVAG
jgi:ring-1,2-phenylacetyl-CoA epoxidase subunit PaaA